MSNDNDISTRLRFMQITDETRRLLPEFWKIAEPELPKKDIVNRSVEMLSKVRSISPASIALTTPELPLYGMWTSSMLAVSAMAIWRSVAL